jgi:serine protease Do
VVNISTVKVIKATPGGRTFQFGPQGPNNPNDPFQQFFDHFFGDQMPQRDRKERSLGSGFIIDPKGLIITNNHVIEGADEVVVRLSDQHEFQAKVVGRDPKTDLALIKITSDVDLPYLELGDSSKIKVGDWVVAIGNPFGLEHTVTAASSAPGAGPSGPDRMTISCRPTPRSTPATPAVRCSTSMER